MCCYVVRSVFSNVRSIEWFLCQFIELLYYIVDCWCCNIVVLNGICFVIIMFVFGCNDDEIDRFLYGLCVLYNYFDVLVNNYINI